jgi:hypothetical protein
LHTRSGVKMIVVYVWMICKDTGTAVSGTKKRRPHLVFTVVMWVFAVVSEGSLRLSTVAVGRLWGEGILNNRAVRIYNGNCS